MISFTQTSFSPWEEVDEREVLMKHSNAAAGWKWLSFHTECWIAGSAEPCKSSKNISAWVVWKCQHFTFFCQSVWEPCNCKMTKCFPTFLMFDPIDPNVYKPLSNFNWVFSGRLNTCLKTSDLFLRKWRQYVLGVLLSRWKYFFAKTELEVN